MPIPPRKTSSAIAASAITPLGIIAAFVALSETVAGFAAIYTAGGIQVAFTAFAVGFPFSVAAAFFTILWSRAHVLYPPKDFGPEVDVRHYAEAMRNQALGTQDVLKLVSSAISETMKSPETQALIRLGGSGGDSPDRILQATEALAGKALDRLQDAVITVDITSFTQKGSNPALVFPYKPEDPAFDLLTAIYFQISDSVEAYAYGIQWVLKDQATREVLLPQSVDWTDPLAISKSNITVGEFGFMPGMRVSVISPAGRPSRRNKSELLRD